MPLHIDTVYPSAGLDSGLHQLDSGVALCVATTLDIEVVIIQLRFRIYLCYCFEGKCDEVRSHGLIQ
jgi:hypothetical protein